MGITLQSLRNRGNAHPIPLHSLHIVSDFEPVIRGLLKCPLLKGVFGFSRAKVSVRCHTSVLFNPAFHHSERTILRFRCIKILHLMLVLQASLRGQLHGWLSTVSGPGAT
jgi:hypothetical protein